MSYDLSVIIPTKNRGMYCLGAIQSIVNIMNPDFSIQIVIQDNSDVPIRDIIFAKFNVLENLKYNYHSGELSFVDNFSEAVSISDGEYVCMIGDDDALLPNIIDEVIQMKKDSADCLVPGLNSVYVWPDRTPFIKGAQNGYLCLSHIQFKRRVVDKNTTLLSLLESGGQNYQQLGLPRLYHGVVSRKLINRIKEDTGRLFDGLTPDIYMSTALALYQPKTIYLNFPVTVSGICPGSGSSNSANGKHTGSLKEAPHFIGHDTYEWNNRCPAIYSVESIWAETMLHALANFNRCDLCEKFNIKIIDVICYGKYPQLRKEIIEHAKKNGITETSLRINYSFLAFRRFVKRIILRLFRKPNSVCKFYDVKEINEAVNITMEKINKGE